MQLKKNSNKYNHAVIQQVLPVNNGIQVCVRFSGNDYPSLDQVYYISNWENGLHSSRIEGTYSEKVPDFLILSNKTLRNWQLNLKQLNIPKKINLHAQTFGNLWFPAVQLCAQNKAAYDLLLQNGVLFWFLLVYRVYADKPLVYFDELLKMPQKEIIKSMGGIGLKREVNFFKKIVLGYKDKREFRMLTSVLGHSHVLDITAQWKKIPISTLLHLKRNEDLPLIGIFTKAKNNICNEQSEFVTKTIQKNETLNTPELKENTIYVDIVRLILDVWNMSKLYKKEHEAVQALRFSQSVKSIQRFHDHLIHDARKKRMASKGWYDDAEVLVQGSNKFPEPIIPGNKDIIPIQTEEDLQAEGDFMNHCVASYKSAVLHNECYVYRILRPERATLAIENDFSSDRGNAIRIIDFRLSDNHVVSQKSESELLKWISENGYNVIVK